MKYVAAFIFLTGIGLGVNYLMINFFRSRFRANNNNGQSEEALPADIKEDIQKQSETLKAAVTELLADIQSKSDMLAQREASLNELLKLVDERLDELSRAAETVPEPSGFAFGSGNQSSFRKVFELHQQGLAAHDIARNLGIGVGEVELRLGILNRAR